MVANLKLILAYEHTRNLDFKNGLEVMNLHTELNREGTTMVMVTHSLHDSEFARRIVNQFDGFIVTKNQKRPGINRRNQRIVNIPFSVSLINAFMISICSNIK